MAWRMEVGEWNGRVPSLGERSEVLVRWFTQQISREFYFRPVHMIFAKAMLGYMLRREEEAGVHTTNGCVQSCHRVGRTGGGEPPALGVSSAPGRGDSLRSRDLSSTYPIRWLNVEDGNLVQITRKISVSTWKGRRGDRPHIHNDNTFDSVGESIS